MEIKLHQNILRNFLVAMHQNGSDSITIKMDKFGHITVETEGEAQGCLNRS